MRLSLSSELIMSSPIRRVAVITGSNKGIGYAIVRNMCKKFDGDVILTSRDETRGKEAISQLKEEGLHPVYHQLDITSTNSIDTLHKFLLEQYGGLDVLINNAGIAFKSSTTASDIEQATVTMATNFTGTLGMSRAMFPLLRKGGRVVNLVSVGHFKRLGPNVQAKFTDPTLTEDKLIALTEEYIAAVRDGTDKDLGWNTTKYGTCVTALIALSKIHAKELAATKEDVLVNACCPGFVRTDMSSHRGPLTPDEGAVTPVVCALLPTGSPTGEFWSQSKVVPWST